MPDPTDLMVIQALNSLPDNRRAEFQIAFQAQKRNRTTALLLSLFLGHFGVDRFYLGQTGLGVAKLLTLGACGAWSVVDWFLIMGAADDQNTKKLHELKAMYPSSSNVQEAAPTR